MIKRTEKLKVKMKMVVMMMMMVIITTIIILLLLPLLLIIIIIIIIIITIELCYTIGSYMRMENYTFDVPFKVLQLIQCYMLEEKLYFNSRRFWNIPS